MSQHNQVANTVPLFGKLFTGHPSTSHNTDLDFAELMHLVIQQTGLTYYQDRKDTFLKEVGKRLATLGLASLSDYLKLLKCPIKGKRELQHLTSELTINETYFFRYSEQFDAIRDQIIPDILNHQNNGRKQLHIWSAGCSIGAEPYSIAIMLDRDFATHLKEWNVSIIATDIDERSLSIARRGHFNDWALRSMQSKLRDRYFLREGNKWHIREKYRRAVSFRHLNLVQDPFPSLAMNSIDLILCRNVMMYFSGAIMKRLIGQFRDCLTESGWLLVGPSEVGQHWFRDFETVNTTGAVLYRRNSSKPEHPLMERERTFGVKNFGIPISENNKGLLNKLPSDLKFIDNHDENLAEIRCLATQDRSAEALRLCGQLLEKDPLQASLHLLHALLLQNCGALEAAEQAFRKVIYLDRKCAPAHFHLGKLYQRRGNPSAGRRAMRNAIELLSKFEDSQKLDGLDDLRVCDLRNLAQSELNAT